MIKRILTVITIAVGIASTAGAQKFTPDYKLRMAQAVIEHYYVDSVPSDKIAEEAIRAMLATLDPHSSYSDTEETKALNEPLQGNFSGIGIQFNMLQDTLYVIQTVAGGPSEQVGIRAGDRITAANDTAIAGVKMANADIIKRLRGPKGSVVNLDVLRRGETKPMRFRVTRDDIPLYSIDATYMAAPQVGYIKISRFAAETPDEFEKAVKQLRKHGMRDLIIDLEDNGGGYLNAAVELASAFLKDKDLIVYTQDREGNQQRFAAKGNGSMPEGRVVVMVNEYSASASEILSGALQDNDRGVVVGRRTFGKGLVQRPFPFPDGSMIRLTVSRYHTPSGRCIQKPYSKGDQNDYSMDIRRRYDHGELTSADSIHFDDSQLYHTLKTGRPVYGGGGIMPDVFVPIDTTGVNAYYRNLRAKNVFNQFALDYIDANRDNLRKKYPTEDKFVESFTITPEILDEFTATAERLGVEKNPEQFAECREAVATVLAGLIGRDLFEMNTYYRIANRLNPVYTEALRTLSSGNYTTILKAPKVR